MEDEVVVGNCDHPEYQGPVTITVRDNAGMMFPWEIKVCRVCGALFKA